MVRDAWAETEESTGEYVATNSGFAPLPEGTRVKQTLEDIKFDSFGGSSHQHLNLKWAIDEPSEFSHRKYFQSIYINGTDPDSPYYKEENQDKSIADAKRMFFAIDKNAGGFIAALKRKPTNEELAKYLIGATMMAVLGVNKDKTKQVVRGISANTDDPKPKAKTVAKAVDSEDIPF